MKVLLATDGSDYSREAAEKMCEILGGLNDLRVKVVSAFEEAYPIAAEPFAVSAEFYQKIIDASENQADHFASETAQFIRKRFKDGNVDVSFEVLKGSPEQQIVEKARDWHANLIVVGSHGRGFWGRMLGSVSDAVVHHAPCSVLVVRR